MHRIISAWQFLVAGYFRLIVTPAYKTRKKLKASSSKSVGLEYPQIQNRSKLGAPGGAAPNGPESRSAGV
jgi:hypothetical protein